VASQAIPSTASGASQPVPAGAKALADDAPRSGGRSPGALLDVALRAAAASLAVLQTRSADRVALRWEEKTRSDFVSDVDRGSEQTLRSVILGLVPEARILGEELSPTLGGRSQVADQRGIIFVADPLDGTTNYLHGYPAYAVSIGVLVDGVLTAGVIRHGVTGDTYTAVAGGGAFRNDQPLEVSSIADPRRSLIGTGFPFSSERALAEYQPQFAAVARETAGIRRAGSAALDLADVAAGHFEGFWELMLAPWDIAAGVLLVREAGGVVTNLAGVDVPIDHTSVVAGNPPIHRWLLDTLSSAKSRSDASGLQPSKT
jgi:myo-inositol-1(or 4)-monophosphatase